MFSAGQMFVSLAICLDFRKSALLDMFLHDQSRSGPFDAFCVSMAFMVACVTGLNVFNILMLGPSDSGKTMLAKRISTVLPTLTSSESIATTRIYSALGRLKPGQPLMAIRPFRSPHHTISEAGLVGSGSTPTPGEISMAHKIAPGDSTWGHTQTGSHLTLALKHN